MIVGKSPIFHKGIYTSLRLTYKMELEDIEGKLVFCLCILNYTDEIFMAI